MADENTSKKPRLRKTAPTLREKAEIARAEAEKGQRESRLKKVSSSVKKPLRRAKLPKNSATAPLFTIGRLLGKILNRVLPRYFINSWREVRQVTWPARKETWRLTTAVFVFATIFGAAVYVVDKGLDEFFKKVILR